MIFGLPGLYLQICMFFKEIDSELLVDRGPDLEKVPEFKRKIIDEKEILFQKFNSKTEMGRLVRKVVSHYAINLV